MRRFRVFATCWLCIALAAGGAPAQPVPGASGPDAAGTAEALVERAKQRFAEGRFQDAVPLLERAYGLSRQARLLFNLGVVHHKLAQCEPAREYFERYLAEDPSGAARSEATSALEELYAHCPAPGAAVGHVGATATPAAPIEQAALPAATRPVPLLPAPQLPSPGVLIVWGAGAALGVSALLSLGLQSRAQHDLDALRARATGKTWDAFEPERAALSENARRYQGLSLLFGIGFAVLAGSGGALWLRELSEDSPELSLGISGVSYRAQF
jgi:tetratricopeptide (TPR) repeat protein